MHEGVNQCKLYHVPVKYEKRQQLRRHYYFFHRGDDSGLLIKNYINPKKIEELCRDCKGTSYEYGQTRNDYWSFCSKFERDDDAFDKFLQLNQHYEKTYIEDEFIKGMDLMAEYKKL
jgi:hypothetical protein